MDIATTRQPALSGSLPVPTFVLTQLDLFNWGAFALRHSAQIDLEGTAIIGPTGSGKTTLVDALMTLIAANPRYNLASTGGHESDRDLISYVRGVSGAGNNSGDNEHIARPGKSVTGISARFSNGDKHLCIAAIFWLEDSSSAAADLKRLWIFSQAGQLGLDEWLEAHDAGGARELKQLGRDTPGLKVCNNKQEYLAHMRRFFEVGENAFTLLNRAAGLKQLNSIDEVFRELVLDDASAFDRAAEVAKEFDDLEAIHTELEVARQQRQSLLPIAESWERRQRHDGSLGVQRELQAALPVWFAELGHRLGSNRLVELEATLTSRRHDWNALGALIESLDGQSQTLRDLYLQAGGSRIEDLRAQSVLQKQIVDERRRRAEEYGRVTVRLKMNGTLTAEALAANQIEARGRQILGQELLSQQTQAAWALGSTHQHNEKALAELNEDLRQVQSRPGSNVPSRDQSFRGDLAAHLGVEEEGLPFVAELVEIKSEDSRWRGAIERAIGGHRMRVMVPSEHIEQALAWVNHRDNRVHVRLLEAALTGAGSQFLADGFTRKLKFKPHPLNLALKRLLAGIDRHCVASPEQLKAMAHALTEQGLMSDAQGRFEKQDQIRLDQNWMTGFDNRDRVADLSRQIGALQEAAAHSADVLRDAQARAVETQGELTFLQALIGVQFSDIDLPAAERLLESTQVRVTTLLDPDSDVDRARARWAAAEDELKSGRVRIRKAESEIGVLEAERTRVRGIQQRAFARMGAGLTDAQRSVTDPRLAVPTGDVLDTLSELEREAAATVSGVIESLAGKLREVEKDLVRQMTAAQRVDTGALAEAGSEMQDVPVYLERLRQLVEEALPEKQQRFMNYLNISSDQGVTQLLSDVENEVSMIEERIEDLNRTLRRVDFQPGRFLRLEPQRVVHESLRTLQQAQRHLRSDALKDDQGESHFRSLRHMVNLLRDASEKKKTLSARALLDPRYRLQFAVAVIDRATAAIIEIRTGSQGGSGGEKEIIASYVLTASLSYALCPAGASRPLFGSVVLDEAFSKSSHAVAGRIISALHEFGLHPLFVTPNKEMRLLRSHTRSAILIHRKGQRATLTSLSWEELEDYSLRRSAGLDEASD